MAIVQRLNGNDGWWLEWELGSEGKPGRIDCFNDEGVLQWRDSGRTVSGRLKKVRREFSEAHIACQLPLFFF